MADNWSPMCDALVDANLTVAEVVGKMFKFDIWCYLGGTSEKKRVEMIGSIVGMMSIDGALFLCTNLFSSLGTGERPSTIYITNIKPQKKSHTEITSSAPTPRYFDAELRHLEGGVGTLTIFP